MRNPYFVLKISWYAGLFIVIGNSFYVEIYVWKIIGSVSKARKIKRKKNNLCI